ncbi:hypothetical protein EDD36DRAFT_236149 [Exophiala viscosa]|uniref:Uncharacterized protein n=1 Tax=Exophiala viscosa TaxID=2486360 RepID=A0AAN6DVU7_9EURO|nr:hypothetical protein EDD36DRAFT_236149 [Exophiala viscosa]
MSCREPIHQMPLDLLSGSLSFTLFADNFKIKHAHPARLLQLSFGPWVRPAFPSKPSLLTILLVALFPVLPCPVSFVWLVAAVVALHFYYFPLQPFPSLAPLGVLLSTTHHLSPQLSVRVLVVPLLAFLHSVPLSFVVNNCW